MHSGAGRASAVPGPTPHVPMVLLPPCGSNCSSGEQTLLLATPRLNGAGTARTAAATRLSQPTAAARRRSHRMAPTPRALMGLLPATAGCCGAALRAMRTLR